jgi:Flp pilus assembly protein TadG
MCCKSRLKKRKREESGQSMVELAVSLVFLLTLIAGVVDLGRAFFTHIALRDAAQEGALYGSINANTKTDNDIETRVADVLSDRVDLSDLDVTVERVDPGDPSDPSDDSVVAYDASCGGYNITVTVAYQNFPITMPFLGAIIGQQVDLSANVVDTILSPPCP